MLSNILNWIKENPTIVIELFLLVLSLLVSLFRKKVMITDNNLVAIVKQLPNFITTAEALYNSPKSGKDKFQFVYNLCIDYLQKLTGSNIDEVTARYSSSITELIEDILATPQKKEVIKCVKA